MHDPTYGLSREDSSQGFGVSPVAEAAESWLRRLQSGLTVGEEVEFAEWLAADARHEVVFRKYQAAWDRFAPLAKAEVADPASHPYHSTVVDSFSARPDLPVDTVSTLPGSILRRWGVPAVGLAASIALIFAIFSRIHDRTNDPPLVLPAKCEQLTLDDGSVVELNRGAEISVDFSAAGRRIRLLRGEANFTVAKDPSRPFVVSAGTVDVWAVGTNFNVCLDPHAVEVLVAEGRVAVGREEGRTQDRTSSAAINRGASADPVPDDTLVAAGQQLLVPLVPSAAPPQVTRLTPDEIEARLAWQPKPLDFDDVPLAAIAAAFNRRNPVRLIIRDPAIANRRMTATFRSDNLEAFIRLLESNIGVQPERINDTEIVLVRKR